MDFCLETKKGVKAHNYAALPANVLLLNEAAGNFPSRVSDITLCRRQKASKLFMDFCPSTVEQGHDGFTDLSKISLPILFSPAARQPVGT